MKTRIALSTLALLASALALSGCIVPTGPVEVTRYNRAAEGMVYGSGSYSIKASDAVGKEQGLLLSPYLAAVAREMQLVGYKEKLIDSDVTAEVAVTTSNRVPTRSPVSVGVGGSTGSYGSGVGLGANINLGGGGKRQVETILTVKLRRRTDNIVIWEGRAAQTAAQGSPAAQPGIAASKLASALFAGFPGTSGETIRIP
jgi:hypothetical protein